MLRDEVPGPFPGENCGQLEAMQLGQRIVWIYPACYVEPQSCMRRAESLELAWRLPFMVTIADHPRYGDGWFAYTLRDPRSLWATWQRRYQLP